MKKILFGLIIFLSANFIYAQDATAPSKAKKPFGERIFFGGGLSLNFGTVTVISVQPQVGYMITDNLAAGVGVTYLYFSQNIAGFGNYSSSIYGGNLFVRATVLESVILTSEYHVLNTEYYDPFEDGLVRGNIPIWYVGGGYRQNLGGRVFASIVLLYDLIDDIHSPYQNPIIRGGISVGL